MRLDSYSGRFSAHLDSNWTVSAGYGYLESPEALRPAEPTHRATASVLHGRRIGMDGRLAAAFVWGINRHAGKTTHAALLETEAVLDRRSTVYGRAELVNKNAEDLVLPTGPSGFAPESTFALTALSLGYIREILRGSNATLGLGFQGTVNVLPTALAPVYGSRKPAGGMVFVRLRPLHGPHQKAQGRMPM